MAHPTSFPTISSSLKHGDLWTWTSSLYVSLFYTLLQIAASWPPCWPRCIYTIWATLGKSTWGNGHAGPVVGSELFGQWTEGWNMWSRKEGEVIGNSLAWPLAPAKSWLTRWWLGEEGGQSWRRARIQPFKGWSQAIAIQCPCQRGLVPAQICRHFWEE